MPSCAEPRRAEPRVPRAPHCAVACGRGGVAQVHMVAVAGGAGPGRAGPGRARGRIGGVCAPLDRWVVWRGAGFLLGHGTRTGARCNGRKLNYSCPAIAVHAAQGKGENGALGVRCVVLRWPRGCLFRARAHARRAAPAAKSGGRSGRSGRWERA